MSVFEVIFESDNSDLCIKKTLYYAPTVHTALYLIKTKLHCLKTIEIKGKKYDWKTITYFVRIM